ncbi:MAG: aspartate carbamoyltransferase, partial [Oscillospiraceae bacterium]|nr:aspartate carbamoyltransferase [Oscillospiraceae bacterium]
PRAVYFRQARYGMFIRMALLLEKQNLPRTEPRYYEAATARYCPNPVCITRTNPYLPDRRSPGGFCEYCDAKI